MQATGSAMRSRRLLVGGTDVGGVLARVESAVDGRGSRAANLGPALGLGMPLGWDIIIGAIISLRASVGATGHIWRGMLPTGAATTPESQPARQTDLQKGFPGLL